MNATFTRRVVLPEDVIPSGLQMDDGARDPAESAPKPPAQDTYQSALLKLIPAEIVTAFLTVDGIIVSAKLVNGGGYWLIFAAMVALCFLYSRYVSAGGASKPGTRQAIVASVAFIIWVFAIGGPFSYDEVDWYSKGLGSILLPLFTLAAPLLMGVKPQPN